MADDKEKKKAAAASKPKATKSPAKEKERDETPVDAVAPRFIAIYRNEIVPKLMKEFNYESPMQVPRLSKIVLNAGLGKATANIKIVDQALKDMASIAGQKPVACKSKLAISNFKLRAGLPIGVMVTLRGAIMYEFLDRLLSLALPRIRDFRGISDRGFDGRGNFTLGLKDQLVFPEVQFDSTEMTFGMNVTFVTTAKTDADGRALLTHFGLPFRKRQQGQKAA